MLKLLGLLLIIFSVASCSPKYSIYEPSIDITDTKVCMDRKTFEDIIYKILQCEYELQICQDQLIEK